MRHQDRDGCVLKDVSGRAAENHLPNRAVAVGPHHQQLAAGKRALFEDRFAEPPFLRRKGPGFRGDVMGLQIAQEP